MIKVPDRVLHALAADLGADGQALAFFGGGTESSDGVVYCYPWQGGERLMKVVAWPLADGEAMRRMDERLKFVHYLGQRGVHIVYPLDAGGGRLLAQHQDGENVFIAYLMDKASGEHLKPEQWSDAFYENFGRTVGELHRAAREYPLWSSIKHPQTGEVLLGWEEEWQFFVPMIDDPEVLARWQSIRERLAQLPITRESHGFIHNDPHTYNILVDGERITLLDFDVANLHWFINDIAIAMQELVFDVTGGMERPVHTPAPLRPTLEAFMRGYRTQNDLDEAWLNQLDLFLSYRRILLWSVLQGYLSERPDVKQSWRSMILTEPPVFGSPND